MKKLIGIVGVLALVGLVGCEGSDKTFAASADKFVNTTVGPEYIEYVNQDDHLSEAQKADRIQNVASFRLVVKQKLEGR